MTEPSNADILAVVQALASSVTQLQNDTQHGFDQVRADIAQVRADVVAVKADTAYTERYIGDLQTAVRRHTDDPNAHQTGRAA
jgi:predicted phage gp36 major capsid-like protein